MHIPAVLVDAGGLHRAHDLVSDAHHAHIRDVSYARSARWVCVGRGKDIQAVSTEES